MLQWSVDALRAAGLREIVVALPPGEAAPPDCVGVRGGPVRSDSVRLALAAASPGAERVVVHDAARPLVDPALFARTLAALDDAEAAIAAARVTDTVKEAEGDLVTATLDRSRLWAVQTPQAFRRAWLERALAVEPALLARATDDAWLVERAGGRVRLVESTPRNLKVTTRDDLKVAEMLLADRLPPPPAA